MKDSINTETIKEILISCFIRSTSKEDLFINAYTLVESLETSEQIIPGAEIEETDAGSRASIIQKINENNTWFVSKYMSAIENIEYENRRIIADEKALYKMISKKHHQEFRKFQELKQGSISRRAKLLLKEFIEDYAKICFYPFVVPGRGYYLYIYPLYQLRNAVEKEDYITACHEIVTLIHDYPFADRRIYDNIVSVLSNTR